jgi:hypothetical protein
MFSFGFDLPVSVNDDDDGAISNNAAGDSNVHVHGKNMMTDDGATSSTNNTPPTLTATATTPLKIIPLPVSLCSEIDEKKIEYDVIPLHQCQQDASADTVTVSSSVESFHLKRVRPRPSTERESRDSDCNDQPLDSDLVSGVYEGGLKTWECSIDLCQYLYSLWWQQQQQNNNNEVGNNNNINANINTGSHSSMSMRMMIQSACFAPSKSSHSHVLELGCGHGLPGILLHKLSQSHGRQNNNVNVMFSDYNDYVLEQVTWPNMMLNSNTTNTNTSNDSNNTSMGDDNDVDVDTSISQQQRGGGAVTMVGGDWWELSRRLQITTTETAAANDNSNNTNTTQQHHKCGMAIPNAPADGRFDCILAAETLYSLEASKATAVLLSRHLTPMTGVGLIATKRYYFGVGGGTDAFIDFCSKQQQIQNGQALLDSHNPSTTPTSTSASTYKLQVDTIESYDSGMGNIRDLLAVRLVLV